MEKLSHSIYLRCSIIILSAFSICCSGDDPDLTEKITSSIPNIIKNGDWVEFPNGFKAQYKDGFYLVEGDMLFTEEQLNLLTGKETTRSYMIESPIRVWPNREVGYKLADNLKGNRLERTIEAINYMNQQTDFNFKELNYYYQPKNYIEFIHSDQGSAESSNVGMHTSSQKIYVGMNAGTGSIIHEIGHALGLLHEHNRIDRDLYINVHWDNIQSGVKSQYQVRPFIYPDPFEVGEYDFNSIMHYSSDQGAANGDYYRYPTMTRKDGSFIMANRNGFSEGDLEGLNRMYHKVNSSIQKPTVSVPAKITVMSECTFRASHPSATKFEWGFSEIPLEVVEKSPCQIIVKFHGTGSGQIRCRVVHNNQLSEWQFIQFNVENIAPPTLSCDVEYLTSGQEITIVASSEYPGAQFEWKLPEINYMFKYKVIEQRDNYITIGEIGGMNFKFSCHCRVKVGEVYSDYTLFEIMKR